MWDKKSQAQVLQVAPFIPRRTGGAAAADGAATPQEMAAEMERVQVSPVLSGISVQAHRSGGVIGCTILPMGDAYRFSCTLLCRRIPAAGGQSLRCATETCRLQQRN